MHLEIGDEAPDFRLRDQNGDPWTLSAHWGTPVVIYFYPAAGTPDCTAQACAVRDSWVEFLSMGTAVVGISPDEVETIGEFVRDNDLPHRLLADPELQAISAYGAWGEKERDGETVEGVIRSSVIIDRDGLVAEVFPEITPDEQVTSVMEVLRDVAG